MGADDEATVWICTDGGEPGTWAPLDPTGWVTPQMFGAMGDGKTDDTEALQSALAAGPYVYLPPGEYLHTKPLVFTANPGSYAGGIIRGAGPSVTQLYAHVELGTQATCELAGQAFALDPNGACTLEDFSIRGIRGGNVPRFNAGTWTNGIKLHSGVVRNVLADNFYAGFDFSYCDHLTMQSCGAHYNYYGAIWAEYANTAGNLTFIDCHFESSGLAGWHVGGGKVNIATSDVTGISFTANPWCIFISDGVSGWDSNGNPIYAGTARTTTALQGVKFRNIDAEGIGNGLLINITTTTQRAADYCQFDLVGYGAGATSNLTTIGPTPTAYQTANWGWIGSANWVIWNTDHRNAWGSPPRFTCNVSANTTTRGMLGIFFQTSLFDVQAFNNIFGQPNANSAKALFSESGAGTNWAPIAVSNTLGWGYVPTFQTGNGNVAYLQQVASNVSGTIAVGQFVEWATANNPPRFIQPCTTRPCGIAGSTGVANDYIIMITDGWQGFQAPVTICTTAVERGQGLSWDSANPTQCTAASSTNAQNRVGIADRQAGAGAAVGIKNLRF